MFKKRTETAVIQEGMLSYFGYGYNTLYGKKSIINEIKYDQMKNEIEKTEVRIKKLDYNKVESRLKTRLNEMYFSGIQHSNFKIDHGYQIPKKIFENYKKEALSNNYIFMWEEKVSHIFGGVNGWTSEDSSFTYELYLSPKRVLKYGEPVWLFV